MIHDFEEILFFELWLKKNGEQIRGRVPSFFAHQVGELMQTSTAEFSAAVFLIFGLTVLSSFLATEFEKFTLFLMANAIFFAHAFLHLGQVLLLRRYVPGAVTSAFVVIPYGLLLYSRLTSIGVVNQGGLTGYLTVAAVAMVPFILLMHKVGRYCYRKAGGLLIR